MSVESQIPELQLRAGRYTMRVDEIREGIKSFPSREGIKYRHDIYFVDANGMYRGEYLTQTPNQFAFTLDEMCCFEVTNAQMHEIRKCSSASASAPQRSQEYTTNTDQQDDDTFSPNVAGKSHCFAMAYAKDIAVAMIRMGHLTGSEEDFMTIIERNAWRMHQWMLDPKPPLPF